MKKHLLILALIAAMCLPWIGQAQTLGSYGYDTGVDTSRWIEVPATGTAILTSTGDGVASTVQNLGFSFPFANNTYTQFSVNSDGNLRLGPTVTSSAGYATPFSAANAATNSPKINFFGCDGYCESNHYVRYLLTEDANGDTVGVVEFCIGSYISATRSNLYKWQVQLYANGSICVVYGDEPAAGPNVARQPGMCVDATDILVISNNNGLIHYTSGTSVNTVNFGVWPVEGRYYYFTLPNTDCPKVLDLAAWNVGESGFDVSWSDTVGSTSWLVRVDSPTATGTPVEVFDTSYTITGLTDNTSYTVMVAAVCSNGDTGSWATLDVRTTCAMLSELPYFYGFEDSPSGTGCHPYCWTFSSNGFGTYENYYPYVNTSNVRTGSKCAYIYLPPTSTTTTGYPDWEIVALPAVDTTVYAISDLTLNFWARTNTTATYVTEFQVGVMTEPSDPTTFQSVQSFGPYSVLPYQEFNIDFASFTGHGNYIAIKVDRGSTYRYLYVDDVTLLETPACPRVEDIVVSNIMPTSVDLSWTEMGTATSYIVQVINDGDTVTEYATDTTITLQNLTPNTDYTVNIIIDCSGEEGGMNQITFRTACSELAELPYEYGFEDSPSGTGSQPDCWKFTSDGTGTYLNYYPYVNTSNVRTGSKALYFYLVATTSTTAGSPHWEVAAMPWIDTVEHPISTLTLNFWGRTSSTTSYSTSFKVGVMTDPTDTSTFQLVQSFGPYGAIMYEEFSVDFANFEGSGNYIAIMMERGSTVQYLYADDFSLTVTPACPRVENVAVSHITPTTADLSWTETGTATAYVLQVMTDEDTVLEYVSDTSYTLENLIPNTDYTVNIIVDCGGNDGGINSIAFRTACVAIDSLPYVYGFEDAETNTSSQYQNVPCWNFLNNATQYFGYPYLSSTATYNHTPGGNRGFYWCASTTARTYGDYQCMIMPAVDTDIYPINTLQVKFWAKASSTSYSPVFQVGVMSDPMNINTFQQVGTVNVGNNTNWEEFTVGLSSFTGYGQYVAVKAVRPASTWYACVDDFTLEVAPSCPNVVDLAIESAGTTGALVSWDYQRGLAGTPSEYEIMIDSVNSTDSPATFTTEEQRYLLSGLVPGTEYLMQVRVNCDADGYGPWDSLTFSTRTLPCAEVDTTSADTVTVTGGTSSTGYYVPVNNYYKYSYTQELVLASEMNGAATITGIDFNYNYTSATTSKNNCTIYLANTVVSDLSNSFVPYSSDFVPVYTGSINCTTGWNHFEFDNAFAYDGSSNLLVVVHDNSNAYDGMSYVFSTHSVSGRARYINNDSNPYDITSVSGGTSYGYRADMKLYAMECMTPGTCAAPMLMLDSVVGTDVAISWLPGNTETAWDVDYRVTGTNSWTSAFVGTTNTSATISGLTPATEYDIRVSHECSTGDTFASMVTVLLPCVPFSVPFSESFDTWSSTAADPLPMCWTKHTNYTTNYPYASTSYAHSGSKSMYMYSTSSSWSYMALPLLAPAIDSLQMSFWLYKSNTTYAHTLYVGVMTDPDDVNTFEPIDTVQCANVSTWEPFEVLFNNYTGNGRYIAFMSPNGVYSYPYLDDLRVEYVSPCPRVTGIAATTTTVSSATIGWTSTEADSYDVEYGPVGFAQGTGIMLANITDDSVQITGLRASSGYDVYVRGNCGGDSSNWSFVYTFRTECGVIDSLPFTENFDSYATGTTTSTTFIPCWGHLNNGTTYFGYPYVSSTSGYNHTPGGSKGLYWFGSTTAGTYGDYYIISLPEVDTDAYPVNTLQLKFWTRATSASYHPVFQVGVMSDPAVDTTFQPVDTVNVEGTEWQLVEIPLTSFTGTGAYVAIKATRPTSAWYANIDDITLEEVPDCQHVTNVHTTVVGLTNATIEWGVTDSTQNNFEVRYGVTGSNVETLTGITVTGVDTIALTGLDSATTYDVYVRADCGSVASAWEMCTFSTLAASPVSTFPYTCTFGDAEGARWDLCNLGQTNQWHVGSAVFNGTTDSMALYVSNDNGVSNAYTVSTISYSWAYRAFVMEAGEYAYSFDWKCQGESANYDYFRVFLVPASEDIVAGDVPGGTTLAFATAVPPAGWYDLSQKTTSPYTLNQQSTWQTLTGIVSVAAGTYKLAFAWANDGSSGTQPPAAIDNISIMKNTCPVVQNLSVDYVSSDTIVVSWNSGSEATGWVVDCNGTSVSVTDSSYAIGGLTPNTDYTIRVSSICSGNDTSLAQSVSARTTCTFVSIPYTENFDSYPGATSGASGVYPNCWTYTLTGTATYQGTSYLPIVYTSSTNAHSGTNSLRLYGVGYFCLPPVDVPLDSLQLSFWNYATSAYYGLEVGVMEGNTFVPIQDVTAASSSTHYQTTMYLSSYTGTSRIIAFRNYYTTSATTYYSYNYLDDIEIDYAPNCMPVYGITSEGVTETSITVDWTDASTASSWQIEYGAPGHHLGNGTVVTTTVHPFTITGLDTLTAYDIYVRPICSSTDTGIWSDAATLSTSLCSDAMVTNIGSTTSTTSSYYYPVNNFFKYTLTETIIDSAELNGAQELSMISYYYQYATATTNKNNCTIYFQPTNKTTFSSNTDVVALDTATAVKVYTGAMNFIQGWNHIALDTTYSYNGTGNLLVIVDDNSNAYNGSGYSFKTAPCNGNKTLSYYNDSQNPDVTNPSAFTGTKSVYTSRVVMQLTSCGGASCATPVVTSTTHDYQSATINWNGNGSVYEVAIKESAAGTWPEAVTVTGNTYTFTGLNPATNYSFRVRQDCTVDSLGYSEWATNGFLTDSLPCLAPDSLRATDVTNATATLDWNVYGNETNWDIHVWTAGFDSIYSVTAHPATVSGFTAGVTYNAAVRALCGVNLLEGDWSDTIQFSTAVCPDVTGLATSDVTAHSVTLNWNTDPMAQSWKIEYGYTGTPQGQGTVVTVNTNTYTVTGLADETSYQFYVQAVCGTDWESEQWAEIFATTLASSGDDCDPVSDLTVTDITTNSAKVTWFAESGSTWNVVVPEAGVDVEVSEQEYALTGLLANTNYDVKVRTICDNGVYSDFVVTSFMTLNEQGIDNVDNMSCTIYPNPTSSATTISVSGVNGKVKIAIVDMNGRTVASETMECAADCEKTLDVENLAQGAYFVRITGESVNMVKKLVVR